MRGGRSRKRSLRKRKRILVTDLSLPALDHRTCIAAINPVSALQVINNDKLKSIAEQVSEKLEKVIKKAAEG